MKNKEAICILGGMGPQASVYMHKRLIELSARYFSARNNEDYPEIIIFSIPVPDFISSEINKRKALTMLKERVIKINNLPVSHIGIACNTAHLLLGQLQNISRVSFVSMIDEVGKTVDLKIKKVGLLASPMTIKSFLYQKVLEKRGIEIITPSLVELEILEKIIRKVIKGEARKKDRLVLKSIANSLKEKGSEGIILGCTELPLVFPPKFSLPVYNSVEILAMALLRKYYK